MVVRLKKKKQKIPVSITWEFPSAGHVKLNVDGFSKENQARRGGGVIRDSFGKVLVAFSYFFGEKTNMETEY